MGRIKEILQAYRTELASVIRNEYKAVFTDGGVLLVMVLAIFIYSTLYASAYAPEVLRNVPIGVIDESQTPSSRELIRTFDAGPNTYVAYEPSGMEEAEELFNCWAVRRPPCRSMSTPATSSCTVRCSRSS